MNQLIEQFFNVEVAVQVFPYVFQGFLITLALSAVLVPVGFAIGLLLALATGSRIKLVRIFARSWVNVFRAFPPLVLIVFAFSALPFLGIRLPALGAAALAMLITCSAYYCEILRAGLDSIPKGQMEAARSTGLTSGQALIYVVLPQGVRNVFPDLASNSIEVVKFTSLASIIGVHEMLHMAGVARSVSYNATPLVLAGLLYLLFLLPSVRLVGWAQARQGT